MKRKTFIKSAFLGISGSIIGADVVFSSSVPKDYKLIGLKDPYELFGKDKEMTVLNNKPWNIEAKAHLLDDKVTPNKFMFIRNNGIIPQDIDIKEWKLAVTGESVLKSKTYTIDELKSKFKHYTYQLTLECGGNGRSEFNPPAKGNQWTVGSCFLC